MKWKNSEFKNLEGLIIKINSFSDKDSKTKEEQINDNKKNYFYSKKDNKIHQAKDWISYYYYDENKKAHDERHCYKILATSDQIKYPSLPLLTVLDLARE